jgi:hypothetical protein
MRGPAILPSSPSCLAHVRVVIIASLREPSGSHRDVVYRRIKMVIVSRKPVQPRCTMEEVAREAYSMPGTYTGRRSSAHPGRHEALAVEEKTMLSKDDVVEGRSTCP